MNAESDKKRKEEVEARNEAEQVIFQVKKAVEDLGSEASDQEKADIDAKIADLENALKGNDVEDIKTKKDELLKASQNIAMKAYQKAQAQQQGNTASNDSDDDAVDAEVTEE